MTIEKVLTAVEELLDASTFSGRAVARKNLRRELSSLVTEEREACAMMCDEESERLRLGGQGEEAQAVHEMGGSIRMRSNVEVRGDAPLYGAASLSTDGLERKR